MFNRETREQLLGVIILSCVEQTNAEQHPNQESYDRALRARIKERTAPEGQKELAV